MRWLLWESIPSHIKEGALGSEGAPEENLGYQQPSEEQEGRHRSEEEEGEIEVEEVAGLTELLAHIDEDGDVTYGYTNRGATENRGGPEMIDIKVVELSPLGCPISTGDIWTCSRKELMGITRWKGSIRGPACTSYPHPKLHTLEGIVKNKPLQDITINDITKCLKEGPT